MLHICSHFLFLPPSHCTLFTLHSHTRTHSGRGVVCWPPSKRCTLHLSGQFPENACRAALTNVHETLTDSFIHHPFTTSGFSLHPSLLQSHDQPKSKPPHALIVFQRLRSECRCQQTVSTARHKYRNFYRNPIKISKSIFQRFQIIENQFLLLF